MAKKRFSSLNEFEGPALSMLGVYHMAKGTDKQKREAVQKKFKKFFDSIEAQKTLKKWVK